MTAPPRITPLQPNSPNCPVLGGTNGVQFAGTTNQTPPMTTSSDDGDLDRHHHRVDARRLAHAHDEHAR